MPILDTAEYRKLALIAAGVDPANIPAILDTATWRHLMLSALYAISQGGGSPGFINGSVQFYADLPITVGTPAVNTAYLVREDSGVWFINRKPAGVYVKLTDTGSLTDWDYAGEFPAVNDSQYFRIYDTSDPTKEMAFDVSDISSGTTRTFDAPNRDGRIAVSDYRLLSANANAVTGDKVAADTSGGVWTLTLPATPSNGDTVTVLDYASTFDTNNLTIARNGSNIESLAQDLDCNVRDAAFTLVYVGSTVGWKVVPYYGNGVDLASPPAIGNTTPNAGTFTTLSANNGTLTASAPVLDLSQTWNDSGTAFTTFRINVTNTASQAVSFLQEWSVDGVMQAGLRNSGMLYLRSGRLASPVGAGWAESAVFLYNGISKINSRSLYIGDGGTGGPFILETEGADVMALRRTTNAQTFNIYNTYTSSTNYERGFLKWDSNVFQIGTEGGASGGTLRGLNIGTAATSLLGFYGVTPVDQPATVTDPTGGGTIDAEARTAINAIIDRLQELGLIA